MQRKFSNVWDATWPIESPVTRAHAFSFCAIRSATYGRAVRREGRLPPFHNAVAKIDEDRNFDLLYLIRIDRTREDRHEQAQNEQRRGDPDPLHTTYLQLKWT